MRNALCVSGELALWSLFVASFIGATLLPGGSEILLYNVVMEAPEQRWLAFLAASTGNILGGVVTYALGRLAPRPRETRAYTLVRRYGAWPLLLSWLPIIGDALVLAAGWLRVPAIAAVLFIALGKCARYLAVIYAAVGL